MLPPKRSLRSWIILSNGEASKLEEEEDEEKEEDIFFYDKLDNRSETKPILNNNSIRVPFSAFTRAGRRTSTGRPSASATRETLPLSAAQTV